MAFRYCNHIKTDGIQCHSPAMREKKYCYYHSLYRRRVVPTKETPGTIAIPVVDANRNLVNMDVREPYAQRYRLGALEDGAALQVAISTVVNALADNRLDLGRASTLLYGLQLASTNLRTFQVDGAAPPDRGVDFDKDAARGVSALLDESASLSEAAPPAPDATAATTCTAAGTYAQVPPLQEFGAPVRAGA